MTSLTAQARNTGEAKSARKAGLLPAVVYGRKEVSTSISVPLKDFQRALAEAGESAIIELKGVGAPKDVLIHDVTYDVVSGIPIHADFYAVEQGQKVQVAIELEFEGVSAAVKDLGGILVKVMHELQVEGEPKYLPSSITVPLEKLQQLDDNIQVKDLQVPSGVEILADENEVVAMISVAQEEPAEETPVDISSIEMSVEKGKKEEETPAEE